jgi:hypothetical protein
MKKPTPQEEEYFIEQELVRLRKHHEDKMKQVDQDERKRMKELHWMRCPKCGMDMEQMSYQVVEIDKCLDCGGIYLDAGELEAILGNEDASVIKRLFKAFK